MLFTTAAHFLISLSSSTLGRTVGIHPNLPAQFQRFSLGFLPKPKHCRILGLSFPPRSRITFCDFLFFWQFASQCLPWCFMTCCLFCWELPWATQLSTAPKVITSFSFPSISLIGLFLYSLQIVSVHRPQKREPQ